MCTAIHASAAGTRFYSQDSANYAMHGRSIVAVCCQLSSTKLDGLTHDDSIYRASASIASVAR